jgi:two-component system invasion response regulator UvrY
MTQKMTGSTRILVLDRAPIVACGLVAVCDGEQDLAVASSVGTAHEAILALEQADYDVLLMDLELPDQPGLDLVHTVHRRWPRLAVLVFSSCAASVYAVRSLRAGVRGYLCKQAPVSELLEAIRLVAGGDHYIAPAVSELLAREVAGVAPDELTHRLSDREFEVFRQLASGKGVLQIANDMCLSRQSVTTYRRRVLDKLEFSSNAEIIAYATRHGLA